MEAAKNIATYHDACDIREEKRTKKKNHYPWGPVHPLLGELVAHQVSPHHLHLRDGRSPGTKFFKNPSGHGCPRRKSWTSAPKNAFSCGPGGGEKHFDPWAFGRKGQGCPRGNPGPKVYFYAVFSSLKKLDGKTRVINCRKLSQNIL